MKLYKYHRINENLLKSIETSTNWYSRIEYLNDPFELFFIDNTQSEDYRNFKKSLCVCSFSKNRNEVLMWSHYAGNHSGLCLEFEIDLIATKTSLIEIDYTNVIQTLSEVERFDSGHLKLNLHGNGKFIRQKLKTWKYEEEIRIIKINEDFALKGITGAFPGPLSGIFFGRNTTIEDIRMVIDCSQQYEGINYYKVDLDPTTVKMDIVTPVF